MERTHARRIRPFGFSTPKVVLGLSILGLPFFNSCKPPNLDLIPPIPSGEISELVIFRINRFSGSAIAFPVVLDGKLIAEMRLSERAEIKIRPGQHYISFGGPGLGVETKPNQTYYISLDVGGWVAEGVKIESKEEFEAKSKHTKVVFKN